LINKEESPRLSRNALIGLVDWVKRRHLNKTAKSNGMEINSQSISSDAVTQTNDIEKVIFSTKGDVQ